MTAWKFSRDFKIDASKLMTLRGVAVGLGRTNDLVPEMVLAWVDHVVALAERSKVKRRGLGQLAISVFVLNPNKTLWQHVFLGKYHMPGLWTHDRCSFSRRGDAVSACAAHRMGEELEFAGPTLHRDGGIEFRSEGEHDLVENEMVDLIAFQAPAALSIAPGPDEVRKTRRVALPGPAQRSLVRPARATPWLRIYLAESWGKVVKTLTPKIARAHV